MSEMIKVLNTETGAVGFIKRRLFENPAIFNQDTFVRVDEEQKPYAPATFKPRSAKKFKEQHPAKVVEVPEEPADEAVETENEVTE